MLVVESSKENVSGSTPFCVLAISDTACLMNMGKEAVRESGSYIRPGKCDRRNRSLVLFERFFVTITASILFRGDIERV